MATFYSTFKSLSVGNKSAVANFHNGLLVTQDPNVIKLVRTVMKNSQYCITEKVEPVVEAVKEAVEAEETDASTEATDEKPKKKTATKKSK